MTAVALHEPRSAAAFPEALSHKLWVDLAAGATKPEPGHGALLGHQWQAFELAGWNYDAGWTEALELVIITSIDLSESQGFDHAIHVNYPNSAGVIYEDRGTKQLNSIHEDATNEIAYDPEAAAKWAFTNLYKPRKARGQTGFEDWAGYFNGVYLHDSYWGRALRGAANMLGLKLMERGVPDLPDGSPYQHKFAQPVLNFEHRVAGQLHFVEQAIKELGPLPKSAAKTAALVDLGRARTAAKAPLPSS